MFQIDTLLTDKSRRSSYLKLDKSFSSISSMFIAMEDLYQFYPITLGKKYLIRYQDALRECIFNRVTFFQGELKYYDMDIAGVSRIRQMTNEMFDKYPLYETKESFIKKTNIKALEYETQDLFANVFQENSIIRGDYPVTKHQYGVVMWEWTGLDAIPVLKDVTRSFFEQLTLDDAGNILLGKDMILNYNALLPGHYNTREECVYNNDVRIVTFDSCYDNQPPMIFSEDFDHNEREEESELESMRVI